MFIASILIVASALAAPALAGPARWCFDVSTHAIACALERRGW